VSGLLSANPAVGVEPGQIDEPRYGWVVVWATFIALAVIFGVAYSFAAFFEPFVGEFKAQRADVSLVFGLCGLVYFVLGAFGGMLSDRLGPRVVVGTGMVCIALGLWGAGAARSMTEVTLAYGVGVGLGIALVYTPAIGTVQPWFVRRRGLAAGLASAGIGAGTLVVPLLATAAIAAWRWRGAMTALAVCTLLLGLTAALLLKRAPAAAKRSDGTVAGTPLNEALTSRTFVWLYAMCALGAFSMFIPFAHLSAAARDLGVPDARAVGLVGLIGIGSLTGRFAIGALADRVGRPRTLILGASFIVWALADGYFALAVFALWMGTSYGGIVSLMPALCMDRFGARAVSSIIGTLYSAAAIGNLAGPWLAGRIFDASGSYAVVTWGCIVLSGLATLCTWQALRPPR
jgi:MFS family permease